MYGDYIGVSFDENEYVCELSGFDNNGDFRGNVNHF